MIMKTIETIDFNDLPKQNQRKIKRFYTLQLKKHPEWTGQKIREKVAERFNINFVER